LAVLRKKEEGRRKKEGGRRKEEEGRRKKEEAINFDIYNFSFQEKQ
jgi:hypothetical protein